MINAAKNKCSDVSIFKGKARNVDYMSSCKLRVLEKKVLFFKKFCPCINMLGLETQWLLACRALILFNCQGFFFFFVPTTYSKKNKILQTTSPTATSLHTSLLYICMNQHFAFRVCFLFFKFQLL